MRRRPAELIRASWPAGAAGRVLLALVLLGLALRLLTIISLWPATLLEDGYQTYAKSNPFLDPLHPAGYSLILGAIGGVTHKIIATVLLQHIAGIISALLLWGATRRVTGSAWPGLLPAGIVLLAGDEIFLEHSIMSEAFEVLAISLGLYAAVRALEEPAAWNRWPLIAGAAMGIAVVIRDTSVLLIAVTVVALLIGLGGTSMSWGRRWRAPFATAAAAAVVLLAYAGANATFGTGFGIAHSSGWYLYGRAAQFADCRRFTPPPGTAGLCQSTPVSRRPGDYYYMFVKQESPATQLFGPFPSHDSLVGAWARRALRAQFGDFLSTAWVDFRAYYVPGSLPARLRKGSSGLDPGLDFTHRGNFYFAIAAVQALQAFFGPFTLHSVGWGVHLLAGWQLVFGFGATALFVTTLLTLLGLVVGTRRSRVGVLLLGVGGVSLLIAPSLIANYSGRYTVLMAGPMAAAAAITIAELWRSVVRRSARRRAMR